MNKNPQKHIAPNKARQNKSTQQSTTMNERAKAHIGNGRKKGYGERNNGAKGMSVPKRKSQNFGQRGSTSTNTNTKTNTFDLFR